LEGNELLKPKEYIRSIRSNQELQKFPNFTTIMTKWEELLMGFYQEHIDYLTQVALLGKELSFEKYSLQVDLGSGYFTFVWNIDKIAKHINSTNMKPTAVPAKVLFKAVNKKELNHVFVPNHPANPIIVIIDINNNFNPHVISGSNRIKETAKKGNDKLDTYNLYEVSHTEFMETKFQELFWKFIYDMKRIEAFVFHPNPPFQPSDVTGKMYLYKEI
jgi:hypothetical protein